MESKKPPFRRRVFLVKKKFQITFLGYAVFVGILTSGINQLFPFVVDGTTSRPFALGILAVIFLFFTCIMLGGLILSNKMAGPLYRLQRHMEEVADGDHLNPVTIRKKDFFLEVIQAYNRVLEKLRSAQNKG